MGKDPIDKFWDIEELLPARAAKKTPPPRRVDTEAVEIAVSEASAALDALAEKGLPIPMREERKRPEKKIRREYEPSHGFVKKVCISSWPTNFSFYTKFRRDAIRLFDRTHEPCEYLYFFSYMPQYDQMTAAQLGYYLYWRGEIRKGAYLKTDINYLFLYTYEIINLPDRIPPKEGAIALSRLWAAYRDDFRYLDKYLGEWLCDYCLIHKVEPDWVTLDVFAGEIAAKVSMPEFYLHDGTMTWALLCSITAYDYQNSKYYPDHEAAFDTHIPKAAEAVAASLIAPRLADFGIEPMRVLRDSFSGAVACHDVKFKLTVITTPLRRSPELKQAVTGIIKLCENQIRAAFGIKSRFLPNGVTEEMKEAVNLYFDKIYPDRGRRAKKAQEAAEEARYMALYEPKQQGKADITRALAIEEAAWETADLLETEDEAPTPAEPMTEQIAPDPVIPEQPSLMISCDPDGEFSFLAELDAFAKGAILAAGKGEFDRFCREAGKMAQMVRDSINEKANGSLGDIIIEEDFTLVSEYEEDILAYLEA